MGAASPLGSGKGQSACPQLSRAARATWEAVGPSLPSFLSASSSRSPTRAGFPLPTAVAELQPQQLLCKEPSRPSPTSTSPGTLLRPWCALAPELLALQGRPFLLSLPLCSGVQLGKRRKNWILLQSPLRTGVGYSERPPIFQGWRLRARAPRAS